MKLSTVGEDGGSIGDDGMCSQSFSPLFDFLLSLRGVRGGRPGRSRADTMQSRERLERRERAPRVCSKFDVGLLSFSESLLGSLVHTRAFFRTLLRLFWNHALTVLSSLRKHVYHTMCKE